MKKQQSITELPESPEDELRGRMLRYGITMGIRLACIIACFFVHGWWLLLMAIGAIVLPYVAVVFANISMAKTGSVERPGAIIHVSPDSTKGPHE